MSEGNVLNLSADMVAALRFALGYLLACERGGSPMFVDEAMRLGAVEVSGWLDKMENMEMPVLRLEAGTL